MDNKDVLTVAAFAEKAGVTKQAIYKQLNNKHSQIQPYIVKRGRQLYIRPEALDTLYNVSTCINSEVDKETTLTTDNQPESTVKAGEETTNTTKVVQPVNLDSQPVSTDYIDFLKQQLLELQAEKKASEARFQTVIQEKDTIIQKQSEQLASLAERVADIAQKAIATTSQQQYLTAVDKQKKEKQPIEVEDTDSRPEEPVQGPVSEPKPETQRKGFWARFFN